MKQVVTFPIFILLFVLLTFGAEKSYYSGVNRSLYISPKFSALGESFQSLSSEPLSVCNPANILKDSLNSVYFSYSGFYENSFSVSLGYLKLNIDTIQSVAVSLSYMQIPDVDSVTLLSGGDGETPQAISISSKSSSEIFFDIRYSRNMLSFSRGRLLLGGAFHAKRRRLINWDGYGFGFDIGASALFTGGAAISFHVEDVTTEYTYWSGEYSEIGLPQSFLGFGFEKDWPKKVGISISYRTPDLFSNSGVGANLSTDVMGYEYDTTVTNGSSELTVTNSNEPEIISVWENPIHLLSFAGYGFEFRIRKIVSFRVGFTDTHKLTFGGGVKIVNRFDVDFVYATSQNLSGSYGVSAKLLF